MDVETTEQTLVEEAKTEAAEVSADLAETKAAAAQARSEGDTDRADRLEQQVQALTTDLSEIKSTLKALAERPFAPAPQPKPKTDAPAVETTEVPAVEDKPKTRSHRFGSRAWFGDRAMEEE